jgi:ribonuclease HIII
VAVDRRIAAELREMGVRDSKSLSDAVLASMADELRGRIPGRFSVVSVSPLEYNRRMEQLRLAGKNSLDLLADCHAGAIARLMSEGADPDLIVIDRFCSEKRVVPLLPAGGYRLELRERGESDTAVAAASILARDTYMKALRRMTEEYGIKAVAGSGRSTDKVVRLFVNEFGPDILHRIVKVHFSNTSRVLSLFD